MTSPIGSSAVLDLPREARVGLTYRREYVWPADNVPAGTVQYPPTLPDVATGAPVGSTTVYASEASSGKSTVSGIALRSRVRLTVAVAGGLGVQLSWAQSPRVKW